ncbi:hypothetical protein AOLI_G00147510 [Acnodon oligacanthus]
MLAGCTCIEIRAFTNAQLQRREARQSSFWKLRKASKCLCCCQSGIARTRTYFLFHGRPPLTSPWTVWQWRLHVQPKNS